MARDREGLFLAGVPDYEPPGARRRRARHVNWHGEGRFVCLELAQRHGPRSTAPSVQLTW